MFDTIGILILIVLIALFGFLTTRTVEDEIDMGDDLAVKWTMRGTHKGLFMSNSPTGRLVRDGRDHLYKHRKRPYRRRLDPDRPDRHPATAWTCAASKMKRK